MQLRYEKIMNEFVVIKEFNAETGSWQGTYSLQIDLLRNRFYRKPLKLTELLLLVHSHRERHIFA